MITQLVAIALLLVQNPGSTGGQTFESMAAFEVGLSAMARDEMQIVSRLRSLREATEKLPETWVAQPTSRYPQELSKQDLLEQLGQMELSAAERWTLLLNNLAFLKTRTQELPPRARAWREALANLPGLQRQINFKLDEYNSRLKGGILMNLARRIQGQADQAVDPEPSDLNN